MKLLNNIFRPITYVPQYKTWDDEIIELSDPEYIVIPLEYPGQILYKPTVKIDEIVHKNQIIAQSTLGNCLHTSISGIVKDVKPIWTDRGYNVPSLFIQRKDVPAFTTNEIFEQYGVRFTNASREQKMKALGIISPWTRPGRYHQEQDISEYPEIKNIVIKGFNEEPSIFVLELLLKKKNANIIKGIKQISDMAPNAIIWMTVPKYFLSQAEEIYGEYVNVISLSNKYKDRIERVVIPKIIGIDIPNTASYREMGVAVISIEYLLLLQDALSKGYPFIYKYLTVSGGPISKPVTIKCPIGTSIRTVLESQEIKSDSYARLLVGGPMKGIAQYNDLTPLTKSNHGIHIVTDDEIPQDANLTCINCGRCVQVCPVNLQVNLIGRYAEYGLFQETLEYHPEACNECGLCAYVCPSHRPLVQLIKLSNKYNQDKNEPNQKIECSIESPLEGWEQCSHCTETMDCGTVAGDNSKPVAVRT